MMIGQLGWKNIDLTGFSNIWQLCSKSDAENSNIVLFVGGLKFVDR